MAANFSCSCGSSSNRFWLPASVPSAAGSFGVNCSPRNHAPLRKYRSTVAHAICRMLCMHIIMRITLLRNDVILKMATSKQALLTTHPQMHAFATVSMHWGRYCRENAPKTCSEKSPLPSSSPPVGGKRTRCSSHLKLQQVPTRNAKFHPLFCPFSSFSRSQTLPVPSSGHSRRAVVDMDHSKKIFNKFWEASGVEIYTDMFLVTCRTRWKLL